MAQHTSPPKSLAQVVEEKPFQDFSDWWQLGNDFVTFMSRAICGQWVALPGNGRRLQNVEEFCNEYVETVYHRSARPGLASEFIDQSFSQPVMSGEFDALSYSFYRSAFEQIQAHDDQFNDSIARERRLFTKRVGKSFFDQLDQQLRLDLPLKLENENDFNQLDDCIQQTGRFLHEQGYLRTHFAFPFDVDVQHQGKHIVQSKADFVSDLQQNGVAYAMYEMGYPVILPSAVYLYHTLGEAQHHSSRTIEELFDRVGYEARETDDFDPIGYPSDRVVELWEIKRLGS